jgi:hypothetical protein
MFLSIGRRAKLRKELRLLKRDIVGEIHKFARDVAAAAHAAALQGIIDSTALASGGLSVFLHALDRCRSSGNGGEIDSVLSEIISDPSVANSVGIGKSGSEHLEAGDLRNHVGQMNSYLAEASSLLGIRPDDRSSALWLAAVRISAASGPPDEKLLVYIVQSRLLVGLIRLNFAKRVEAIGALMR